MTTLSSSCVLLDRLTTHGPLDEQRIRSTCSSDRDRLLRDAAHLMRNRVSLLDGYEQQELGDPIDWFRAPRGDLQWPTHLSRHYWLMPLGYAYRATRERHYAQKIVDVLIDWVERFPIGVASLDKGRPDWTNPGTDPDLYEMFFPGYCDGPWTSLSAHARFDAWSALFQLIAESGVITESVAERLSKSLFGDHVHLMIDFPRKMNQYQSIANSLVTCGWYYPEVSVSARAQQIGWDRMARWVSDEIYPDGSLAECSFNYGLSCVRRLQNLVQKADRLGQPVPVAFRQAFARAVRYLALTTDPTGQCPRLAKGAEDMVEQFKAMKLGADHPEAVFITGADGATEPRQLSFVFPWAGHAVARSDWSSDAAWLFFDMGPRGSGHCDWAQLGLQFRAGRDMVLVDPGYYVYSRHGDEGRMAVYLNSTAAHNAAVIDGSGQAVDHPNVIKGPNRAPGEYTHHDVDGVFTATACYDRGFGEHGCIDVIHHRTVTFDRRAQLLVVEDGFEATDAGTHLVQVHWQLAPNAETNIEDDTLNAIVGSTRIRAVFAGNSVLTIDRVRGQKIPPLGWYSDHYGQLEPTDTVIVSQRGVLPITIKSTFGWSRNEQRADRQHQLTRFQDQ
jgi:hypothetical protein